LDASGTLHHVMVRGIERTSIFRDDTDRTDFLLELVRYLHLNPLRAKVVADLRG